MDKPVANMAEHSSEVGEILNELADMSEGDVLDEFQAVALLKAKTELSRLSAENAELRKERDALKQHAELASLVVHGSKEYAETLEARLSEALEALRPFADAAQSYEPDEGDNADVAWAHDFTIGSLRRAHTFLNSIKEE